LKWGVAIEVVNIQGFVTFLKGGEVEASALASPIFLGFRTTKIHRHCCWALDSCKL
jgi:hypothetical protein